MKSDAERGPVGAWARRAGLDAGYTSAERAVEAATVAGVHVTVPYLRGIEAGTNRAGKALLRQLGALYGSEPPVSSPPSSVPPEAARRDPRRGGRGRGPGDRPRSLAARSTAASTAAATASTMTRRSSSVIPGR